MKIRSSITLFACVGCLAVGTAGHAWQQAEGTTLDEAKQKYIWDMEHAAFVLETYLGRPLLDALDRGDKPAVRAAFHEEFEGRLLRREPPSTRAVGPVEESRRSADEAPLKSADARAFAGYLLDAYSRFEVFRGGKLKVLLIDRLDDEQRTWTARIRFDGRGTDKAGRPLEYLSVHEAEFLYESSEDVKNGGVIRRLELLEETWRRSADRLFEEVTASAGLADLPLRDNWKLSVQQTRNHRYQMAVADYDRDGWLDIVVASIHGDPLLLRSIGGQRFEDATGAAGIVSVIDRTERDVYALAAWIDYDNDDYPDLLLGDQLYHNEQGRKFARVTERSGLVFERSPFGAMVADFDVDGDLDLYLVNQKGFRQRAPGQRPWVGDPEAGTENHMWRNEGGGRFVNVTAQARASGGRDQTFAASTFFFDADHYPDLYLANDFGANVLLRNRGDGSFEDVTRRTGTGDFSTSMGVTTGDLDNDGTPELYVANMYSKMGRRIIAHLTEDDYAAGIYDMIRGSLAGNRLYYRDQDKPGFSDVSNDVGVNEVGWAYAPAMIDLDGNGLLDIYATTGFLSYDKESADG